MTFPHGGDYCPEQWPREIWDEDDALFDKAGINTETLGVFLWSRLQPDEETFDFSLLDEFIERAARAGRGVVLATPTGAMPPWLVTEYPGAARVDFEGRQHRYGARHNFCPTDPDRRRLAVQIAERLAERYGGQPHIRAWHIGNEFGGACYCESCAAGFRSWLQARYGDLETLNQAWYTDFWSHRFTDWLQIVPPNATTEHWNGPSYTAFQGITLDYYRFMSDVLLDSYRAEADVVRKQCPGIPVTTNMMGLYYPLDYAQWAPHLDFASWDNYPPDFTSQARMAMTHDLMRGLKSGQPFWVMEQTPSTTACRITNPVKTPGLTRLWSLQSIAHGADAILYFQLRQGRGACEKYHGAVIAHDGRSDTRVFTEVAQIGAELPSLEPVLGTRVPARVALLWSWESWWALTISDGPSRLVDYRERLIAWYAALWRRNVLVDVVHPDSDLGDYQIVLAPLLHLVADDFADRTAAYVSAGGTFVTGTMAGRVDPRDQAYLGDQPGAFAALMDARVEEVDTLELADRPALESMPGQATLLADSIIVPESSSAEVLARFTHTWLAGKPAVIRTPSGAGHFWYVGTEPSDEGLDWLVDQLLEGNDLDGGHPGLEVVERADEDGRFLFLLNHGGAPVQTTLTVGGRDMLGGDHLAAGSHVTIAPTDALVVALDQ